MHDLSQQLTRSLARVHMIKAVQPSSTPGVMDVLIAPFWGPYDGRDAHDQYFTPATNFMHDVIPNPPVFHYHGAEMGGDAKLIGKSADRWTDDLGVWQTVILDMTDPNSRQTWQASMAGNAYASTGVVPASLMVNNETGEIQQWLIGEISLMVMDVQNGVEPANTYAIALPRLKALRASLPPERRRMFDQVYLVENQTGAKIPMDVIEQLQAFFARFIQELSDELDTPVDEVADIVEEAVSDGVDVADDAGDTETVSVDSEVSDAVDALIDALDTADMEDDGEPVMAKSASRLRRENAQLRAKLARQSDAEWIGKQVAAKRVTPAEKPAVLEALTKARSGGKASAGTVTAIKAMVEARPTSGQRTTLKTAGLSRAGFQSPPSGANGVIDQATMKRMKAYAGMED